MARCVHFVWICSIMDINMERPQLIFKKCPFVCEEHRKTIVSVRFHEMVKLDQVGSTSGLWLGASCCGDQAVLEPQMSDQRWERARAGGGKPGCTSGTQNRFHHFIYFCICMRILTLEPNASHDMQFASLVTQKTGPFSQSIKWNPPTPLCKSVASTALF